MAEQIFRIKIKNGDAEIEVEGDKEFVEKHIEDFKKERLGDIAVIPKDKSNVSTTSENSKIKTELKYISLAEFYKKKQPKDHNETVVVFAFWLEKKEQKDEFQTKDLEACYELARLSKPKNLSQHVSANVSGRKAYLTSGNSKGSYRLTLTGLEFIEKELPRENGQ